MTLFLIASVVVASVLAYSAASGWMWIVFGLVFCLQLTEMTASAVTGAHPVALTIDAVFIVIAVILKFDPLRRALISNHLLAWYRRILPPMSQTEREAIDAGSVWWDGDLFSGKPDWSKLLAYPAPKLSAEEQSFLDNETDQLCAMTDDWETTQVHLDLSPQSWQYIKDKGFLGMIIPKKYGGKEFSAYAHSQVVQ